MAQELLNASQISSTLQEVRRRAVPQAVGPEIRRSGHAGEAPVDQGTHRSGVDPTAAHTE